MHVKQLVTIAISFLFSFGFVGLQGQQVPARPLIVINVLPEKYYEDCHIPGSINIPIYDLNNRFHELNKMADIIIYCAHALCSNGPEAWYILKKLGFEHLILYPAGIAGWYQAGLPVVGPSKDSYLQIKQQEVLDHSSMKVIETYQLYELLKVRGMID